MTKQQIIKFVQRWVAGAFFLIGIYAAFFVFTNPVSMAAGVGIFYFVMIPFCGLGLFLWFVEITD